MIRAFFAIDLPQSMQNNILYVMEQLHEYIKNLNYSWSKPNNLHITLQFLKAVQPDDILKLIENVRQKLRNIQSFEIEFNHIELFPNLHRPRYITLIPAPNDTLNLVAKCIGEGILETNYAIEAREFRPHLTLGKIFDIPSEIKSFDKVPLGNKKMLINEIIFYQSNPSKHGSIYIPLERIEL